MKPHNIDAERAVLGAALQSPFMLDDLTDVLEASDFYQPQHETIWQAIVACHSRGERPDPLLVDRELGPDSMRLVGGLPYLHDLTSVDTIPIPAQAPHYAGLIRDCAMARRLLDGVTAIRQRVEQANDAEGVGEDARKILDDALAGSVRVETGIGAAALVSSTLVELDSDIDPGIQTGWHDLDLVVNGLRAGQLVIVGARPSVGKSVIAANVAAAVCRSGVGVHFASLEMTRGEVMRRMLAAHATVNLSNLMNQQLTSSDWQRIAPKSREVSEWPLWVDDQGGQSLAQVRARAKRTERRIGLGLIVVDYLQLMAPRVRRAPREQQVGELSEGLKGLAKEMGVPVIALAQVNRGSADRQDKRPMMSDLRESGRIEADADHVWLLHRQDLVDPSSTTGELEVIVAKNRNGIAGRTINLAFQGHYSRAAQMARDVA